MVVPSQETATHLDEASMADWVLATQRVARDLTWYEMIYGWTNDTIRSADTTYFCTPQVKALKGQTVIQAACGGSHTLFVTSDGIAYVAGRPECVPLHAVELRRTCVKADLLLLCLYYHDCSHGRLGMTDMKPLSVPTRLDLGPIPVRQVSAGGAHSMALTHSSRPIFSPMISPLPASKPVPHTEL